MKLENLTLKDIKRGYTVCDDPRSYACVFCEKRYEVGEIYPVGNRFFDAKRAIQLHLELEHGDCLHQLIGNDSKYNTLTENQKRLMQLFAAGFSDKEIATELGVSPSTVRHQKFMFREKAKQAKFYLAIYERAFENSTPSVTDIVPVHDNAKMVDERYIVTQEEREHILKTSFSSLDPLRLKEFSPKEKKKVVILSKIAEQFEQARQYSEKEVNELLGRIFDDYVTLRRYLIEYGFMQRTKDCSKYWLS